MEFGVFGSAGSFDKSLTLNSGFGGRIGVFLDPRCVGERNPTAAGTSTTAKGLNRRNEFRLLIASDYLVPPRP